MQSHSCVRSVTSTLNTHDSTNMPTSLPQHSFNLPRSQCSQLNHHHHHYLQQWIMTVVHKPASQVMLKVALLSVADKPRPPPGSRILYPHVPKTHSRETGSPHPTLSIPTDTELTNSPRPQSQERAERVSDWPMPLPTGKQPRCVSRTQGWLVHHKVPI